MSDEEKRAGENILKFIIPKSNGDDCRVNRREQTTGSGSNFSDMTDLELNIEVAVAIGYIRDMCELAKFGKPWVGVEWDEDRGTATKTFDFCNSWADAGPIISEHGIGLMPFKSELPKAWDISTGLLGSNVYWHENILRAAMIVFLVKQEG